MATEPLRVLSLGWGVQSWTLAAMMALDEIPRCDYLVHADTGHEQQATYDFAEKWTPWLGEHGLQVVTVHAPRTEPVRKDWGIGAVMIPAFSRPKLGGDDGQVNRQCTIEWKIRPIRRFVREELKARGIKPRPGAVEQWLGISVDEWKRARTSDVKYITTVHPLLDRKITRARCIQWLGERGLPVPAKSSCTFCPYHRASTWREMKRADGLDWKEAIAVDKIVRDMREEHTLYVHAGRQPLEDAVDLPEDAGQLMMDLEEPCDSGYCYT